MLDPRAVAVEANLSAFMDLVSRDPLFTRRDHDDALVFTCDLDFPLFNVACDAAFAPGRLARRTAEIADELIAHGRSWRWGAGPGSLPHEPTLLERGLERGDAPGMHVALTEPLATPDDIRVGVIGTDRLDVFLDVFAAGFEMPEFVIGPFGEVIARTGGDWFVNVVAWDGPEPVGCGTLVHTGRTAGLYNIATLRASRGRGVGGAVTAALMNLGLARGCTEAVLTATPLGQPVYERLGFVEVCPVIAYGWTPGANIVDPRHQTAPGATN